MKYIFSALLALGALACSQQDKGQHEEAVLTDTNAVTIAFGSCAHTYDSLPIFTAVAAHQPALWVWLGDIMYGDSHDMGVLAEKYRLQKEKPEYRALRSTAKVIGIWDDHDYGVNDGGKYYTMKDESKELLLDFLDVPADDPVRGHQGVYSAHDYPFGDHLLKVILLDTRYFRDTLAPDLGSTNRYLPNEEGDILGEEQWQWLANELKTSKADFHLIGSGIQVIAEEQGYEKWANFPRARQRLFALLAETKPKPVLFISGDRHIAEVSKITIPGLDYPLYDFTSSGLTHTWGMAWGEPNRYRVDSLIINKNFGLIRLTMQSGRPQVTLEVRGENDELLQQTRIAY